MHKSLPIVSIPKRALVVALPGIPHVPYWDTNPAVAIAPELGILWWR